MNEPIEKIYDLSEWKRTLNRSYKDTLSYRAQHDDITIAFANTHNGSIQVGYWDDDAMYGEIWSGPEILRRNIRL